MKNKEIEKMLLEEYQNEKGIICGCEEISFEEYCKFRMAEIDKMYTTK